ncbi:MAG: tryptophan--tRNA ligase [Ignavibacteriae bacterium]|nr:tryptophan--tRNA ligase [Ignavibacteriota bacterium]
MNSINTNDSKSGNRPIILSGIQPTGGLHIGNLFGAIKNWVAMQDEYQCYFTIVDLHSITVRQIPAELRKSSLDLAAMLIACGIDTDKSVLFVQSHVPEHAQLAWVLNCYTGMGELSRMTQFKDKSAEHYENVNAGLFTYPVLMASDILLYQADLVPVGEDQKQHLELTRDIAQRFNHNYSDTFKIPEPYIPKTGARIMSLQEPTKKMSKSDGNSKATIFLTDSDEEIKNKIKRAVTDSGELLTEEDYVEFLADEKLPYNFSQKRPGLANLITLYQVSTNIGLEGIVEKISGIGFGDIKSIVAEAMAEHLNPIRTRYNEIRKDENKLKEILSAGAEKAQAVAFKTLRKVYKKVGFYSL